MPRPPLFPRRHCRDWGESDPGAAAGAQRLPSDRNLSQLGWRQRQRPQPGDHTKQQESGGRRRPGLPQFGDGAATADPGAYHSPTQQADARPYRRPHQRQIHQRAFASSVRRICRTAATPAGVAASLRRGRAATSARYRGAAGRRRCGHNTAGRKISRGSARRQPRGSRFGSDGASGNLRQRSTKAGTASRTRANGIDPAIAANRVIAAAAGGPAGAATAPRIVSAGGSQPRRDGARSPSAGAATGPADAGRDRLG